MWRRIGVFGDVVFFLDHPPRVGEKRRMRPHPGAIFIRLRDIVGADGDQPAIGNFELAMECNQPFGLAAVLGTETSAAEHQDHRVRPLQFRELAASRGMVGQLIVGEECAWNNVGPHGNLNNRMHVSGLGRNGCAEPDWKTAASENSRTRRHSRRRWELVAGSFHSTMPPLKSVWIAPGATTLAVIRRGPSSLAR